MLCEDLPFVRTSVGRPPRLSARLYPTTRRAHKGKHRPLRTVVPPRELKTPCATNIWMMLFWIFARCVDEDLWLTSCGAAAPCEEQRKTRAREQEKEFYTARRWRALAQVNHGSRLSNSREGGKALSSVNTQTRSVNDSIGAHPFLSM